MKNFRVREISTGNLSNISEDMLSDKFEVIDEVNENGDTSAEVTAIEEDELKQAEMRADTSKHL